MTATLDETDTDWLTLIDFEEEIACDYNKVKECLEEVKWKVTNHCCGAYFVFCNPHKEREMLAAEFFLIDPRCTVCHAPRNDFTVTPL